MYDNVRLCIHVLANSYNNTNMIWAVYLWLMSHRFIEYIAVASLFFHNVEMRNMKIPLIRQNNQFGVYHTLKGLSLS